MEIEKDEVLEESNVDNEQENPEETSEETVEENENGSEEPEKEPEDESEEGVEEKEEDKEEEDKEEEDKEEEDKEEEPEEEEEGKVTNEFFEFAKRSLPDRKFKNNAELYRAIMDEYTELEVYRQENSLANQKMVEVLDNHPQISALLRDLADGLPDEIAVARNFDVDGLKPVEGDENYDAWVAEQKRRDKLIKEAKKFEIDRKKNQGVSIQNIIAFQNETGMSDDETNTFAERVLEHIDNAYHSRITPEFLKIMFNGMNYQLAVDEARKQGEIKGRNANIEEEIKDKDKRKGDGLPHISSEGMISGKRDRRASAIVNFQKKKTRFD